MSKAVLYVVHASGIFVRGPLFAKPATLTHAVSDPPSSQCKAGYSLRERESLLDSVS